MERCVALSADGLAQMVRLIAAAYRQLLVFRVSPMGAKRRRRYRMHFAQPPRTSLALQGTGAERSDCCHPSNVSLSPPRIIAANLILAPLRAAIGRCQRRDA